MVTIQTELLRAVIAAAAIASILSIMRYTVRYDASPCLTIVQIEHPTTRSNGRRYRHTLGSARKAYGLRDRDSGSAYSINFYESSAELK